MNSTNFARRRPNYISARSQSYYFVVQCRKITIRSFSYLVLKNIIDLIKNFSVFPFVPNYFAFRYGWPCFQFILQILGE